MKNSEVYAAITEKIISNLESAGSWVKLWQVPSPISINGHIYSGVNRLVLSADAYNSRVYGTFQQIRMNGGKIRRGEKSSIVVFWKKLVLPNEDSGESKNSFVLRYYHVFNTEQADFDEQGNQKIATLQGLVEEKLNDEHFEAEEIILGYQDRPQIIYSDKDDRAFYSPSSDLVSVPDRKFFVDSSAFYRTLFHELGHSTGHPKRLNRYDGMISRFGDIAYSKEELVAELCSSYLAGTANLDLNIRNSAAYIKGWVCALRDNHNWILWASSRAEKATNYILGKSSLDSPETGLQETEAEIPVPEPVSTGFPF